jgi:hypothetical protein
MLVRTGVILRRLNAHCVTVAVSSETRTYHEQRLSAPGAGFGHLRTNVTRKALERGSAFVLPFQVPRNTYP